MTCTKLLSELPAETQNDEDTGLQCGCVSGTHDCVESCSAVALDICGCGAWKYSVSKGTEGIPSAEGMPSATCSRECWFYLLADDSRSRLWSVFVSDTSTVAE